MTKPYYADDRVTLYHGRCEDVLPTLDPGTTHLLLTDPPYFQVKDDEWDNQWQHATQVLGWLGDVLDAAKPALTANASAWVFAGPALASRVEGVVSERFRVLNHIRWVKEQGWHQKAEIEAQRRYLTPWEGIVFAEQFADEWQAADYEAHKAAFRPVGDYLSGKREAAGLSRADLAAHLARSGIYNSEESAVANVSLQEIGSQMLSARTHAAWSEAITLKSYRELAEDYQQADQRHREMRRDYEGLRRPFRLKRTGPVSDVWNFDTVAPYAGKHPCEKPQALLRHMIDASSRPGDLILDPFAGSGSTLIAARDAGRRAVGIEMDLDYCRRIADRLSQGALDFEVTA